MCKISKRDTESTKHWSIDNMCHHMDGTVKHVVTLTSVKHHAKLNEQFKYYFYRLMVM